MNILVKIAGSENLEFVIKRNWFTGDFVYIINGQRNIIRSFFDVGTHVSVRLKKKYQFEVGDKEIHKIEIEHIRPLFFAGFRPHNYEVLIDGASYTSYHGY
jgi:hypothetical protein